MLAQPVRNEVVIAKKAARKGFEATRISFLLNISPITLTAFCYDTKAIFGFSVRLIVDCDTLTLLTA
jgi:hypothetical protein